jgi:hypothetical protein
MRLTTEHLARPPQAVIKGAVDLALDLVGPPWAARVVRSHLARRPQRRATGEIDWYSSGAGKAAERVRFTVEGGFLLSGRCGDDPPAGTIQRRVGIGREPR